MKTKILLSTTLFFMFLFIQGQIINIPDDYPTIQLGIEAATDGDTVLVQPDTYPGNINFLGKEITVGSLYLTTEDTNYISQTIIDGGQNGTSVVTFENEESEEAKLIGFTITNGYSSTSGGGVMCVYSNPSLHYLYILDNEAVYNGGGIICGAFASPSLYHIKIQNNFAGNDGGGMYCYNNCNPSLENVILSENSAGHGGGICCLENCSPGLNQVVITNNDAQQGGGIFCAFNSNLNLQDVALIGNEANAGGGVFMSENSLTFINTTIANNTATTGGGIFADNFSEIYIDSTDISGNIATDRGAGIYSFNSSFYQIQNSFITENEIIGGFGGGITFDLGPGFEERPEVIIENTLIADNFGSESGTIAGVNFYLNSGASGADITINNCVFENNSSNNSSALNIGGEGFSFDILNCIFRANEAVKYTAGAALAGGCSGSVYNCLFESNIANLENQEWNSGGATVWGGSEVEFFNCTFVDNSAFTGSAFAVGYDSDASLVNSIVWDNDNNSIAVVDFNDTGSTLMIGQCDIEGAETNVDVGDLSEVTWVGDNLDEDPLFMGTGDHPYSLDMGSPCIDAGVPDTTGMELPDSDILGNYRVWDGDGDQVAVIDMGPYEYGSVGVGTYEAPGEVEQQCTVFPNPFTTSTHIEYELKEPSKVQFSVFNQIGQLVYQLSEEQNQGVQQLSWKAESQPKGIYFYSMQVGDKTANGKIVKVR